MKRVADYIADFIYEQEVKDVFILSGGGSIYLDDGIACHPGLNEICVHNEATAPMMAEAYARLNNNLGVAYVTTGPGGTNAVAGLAEAWVDSAPVLVISGQVEREYTTHNSKLKNFRTYGTQEINIIEVVTPLTKYAVMVNDPNKIRYHLEKAVYLAKSGRPGPVWLDIPLDVQSAIVDYETLKGYKAPKETRVNVKKYVKKILKMLNNSQRPVIIAGQGIRISGAVKEFSELVKILGIPVVSSRLGQDILSFSHTSNMGHGGMKGMKCAELAIYESDLIISLGSRLSLPFIQNNLSTFKTTELIMVDVDDAELKKDIIDVDLLIKADVKTIITGLLDKVGSDMLLSLGFNYCFFNWLHRCTQYKERYKITPVRRDPIDLYYFMSRLDALSEEDDIFISDAGSSYYIAGQMLKFKEGQREITSGAFASMGLTIPLAIGCATARRYSRILAVIGDGSLELNMQELITMSVYKQNINLFVINNGGYVSIRNAQDALFNSRYINSDQANCNETLNYKKLADTFNIPYFKIQKCNEVDDKISDIINKIGPALIEVVCDNKQKIISPI